MEKKKISQQSKNVALVLSSGGPRGFAYIGAIEELERRGYNITSVAGTSIGSLIGGIYAAGKMAEIKEWLFTLDAWEVFKLMDFSISLNHLVKGDKVIEAIREMVSDVDIEDLRIPYVAVATDLRTGKEVVFDKGNLFTAIRSSISIPSLFRPVEYGDTLLIDGGIVNSIPLDRVHRSGNDILVAFNVNDIDAEHLPAEIGENYFSILSRTFDLMNHVNSNNSIEKYSPDVLVNMPVDAYGEIADYAKAPEICELGRDLMRAALDSYEAGISGSPGRLTAVRGKWFE